MRSALFGHSTGCRQSSGAISRWSIHPASAGLLNKALERASPGKFVETFVQCLQHMATGTYEPKPDVEDYLLKRVENVSALPEGLRICAARIARSVYTLRNKRNIAHKNEVDPNTVDLAFAHQATAWILADDPYSVEHYDGGSRRAYQSRASARR